LPGKFFLRMQFPGKGRQKMQGVGGEAELWKAENLHD
jgi:hypothetical protein